MAYTLFMNRPIPSNRTKWLVSSVLAMGLSGCITYTGDYANDGYYSSPDRYGSYDPGNYGEYYYSAVPSISISYNFYYGHPFYGFYGCNYWSPYCGWGSNSYAYAFGPGYGFGWGHRPYYGYEERHHPHKPKPKPELPDEPLAPPSIDVDTPVVMNPIRGMPVNPIRTRPKLQSVSTPPVSTGSSHLSGQAPQSTAEAPQRTTYWRIPQNQRQAVPAYGRKVPVAREEVQIDDADDQINRSQPPRPAPVFYRNPKPANNTAVQEPRQIAIKQEPEPQQRIETRERSLERQLVREPTQVRSGSSRRVSVQEDGDP
jgi:hypothetical protein